MARWSSACSSRATSPGPRPTRPRASTRRSCTRSSWWSPPTATTGSTSGSASTTRLTEYCHISASEVFIGYLRRATERIHLGSGIFNLSPRVNHPVRNAERVAMLDHLTDGRFEFGTGRGAGCHEVATFNIHDTSLDPGRVGRGHPRDPADVGAQGLHVPGRATSPSTSRTTSCPSRTASAIRRSGWPAATRRRSARRARSASARSASTSRPIHDMRPQIDAYKEGIAELHRAGRPVRQRQRDDHQRRRLHGGPASGPGRSS